MLLLGQHITRTDWRKAIEWYEKARPLAPKASTRIGLVLAQKSTEPADLARAWTYFQEAAAAGDLDGKVSVADCLLDGTVNGRVVEGLKRDQERAVAMLREIIAAASPRGATMPFEDVTREEKYATDPNRSKLLLGSFLLETGIQAPSAATRLVRVGGQKDRSPR